MFDKGGSLTAKPLTRTFVVDYCSLLTAPPSHINGKEKEQALKNFTLASGLH